MSREFSYLDHFFKLCLIPSFVIRTRFLVLLLSTFFLCTSSAALGQETQLDTAALRAELDLLRSDSLLLELRSLLDSIGTQKSFLSVSLSVTNRLFSAKNIAFNAQQASTGLTALSPSVSYMHKSGFGMNATGYARNVNGTSSLYQTAISPSYDHFGNKAIYGISYTYYAKKENLFTVVTPFDHELYAYIQSRKKWLRPSLAMGWANGRFQDVQTRADPRFPNRMVFDTSLVKINDFSLIGSLSHTFSFKQVFAKEGLLLFIPQFSLIGGLQQYNVRTKTSTQVVRPRDARLDRFRSFYKVSNNSSSNISLQTAAFSASISWNLDYFSISSGYFCGYYFDTDKQSRFSHIFNLGVGLTF